MDPKPRAEYENNTDSVIAGSTIAPCFLLITLALLIFCCIRVHKRRQVTIIGYSGCFRTQPADDAGSMVSINIENADISPPPPPYNDTIDYSEPIRTETMLVQGRPYSAGVTVANPLYHINTEHMTTSSADNSIQESLPSFHTAVQMEYERAIRHQKTSDLYACVQGNV